MGEKVIVRVSDLRHILGVYWDKMANPKPLPREEWILAYLHEIIVDELPED